MQGGRDGGEVMRGGRDGGEVSREACVLVGTLNLGEIGGVCGKILRKITNLTHNLTQGNAVYIRL